jgi:hypothetical protein
MHSASGLDVQCSDFSQEGTNLQNPIWRAAFGPSRVLN